VFWIDDYSALSSACLTHTEHKERIRHNCYICLLLSCA